MSGKLAIFAAMGGAHALAAREAGCSLTLTTGGAVSYPVGQHSSGQTRAGSSLPATTFTYENTTLTDSQGRGCWWTPPATVLQCDVGQIPETGFEIGCDGSVSYNGQTTFYECLTGDSDEVNIYRLPDQGSNCAEITLTASGCYSSDCSGGNNSGSQSATATQPTGSSQGYSTAPGSTPTQSTGAGSTPAYQTASTKAESTSAYSATQIQSKPDQSTQTPATPIVSTIYSTTMVTISSCGPEVSSCPAASTPAPVTETIYSTTVVTVSGPAGECTPGTVSVPFTETETQPAPTTTQTSQATIPVYETSVQTTTKASTIETTATQSTHVTVPVYSTSIATESTKITETQKTQSTVPVYSTSVATQSTKTTATEKTQSTVPVYSTSVATQKTESTVPVYSTSVATTKATQSVETSVPVYPTTLSQKTESTVPVYSTSLATTKATQSVETSAPVYPTTLSQKTSQPATSASSTPATTQSTTSGVTVPSPSTVTIPSSCPANGVTNAGEFNLPSLIIVTDKTNPNTANGTQYFGDITPTRSTIFNFDIPASDAGKTCELSFLFPEKDTLETSTYTFSGSGALDFYKLSSAATQSTSYSNAPSVESDLGQFTVSPGNAYTISSFACPSGSTISIEIADVSGGDTNLYFFQDYNPCPLGLFITTS